MSEHTTNTTRKQIRTEARQQVFGDVFAFVHVGGEFLLVVVLKHLFDKRRDVVGRQIVGG